MNSPIALTIPEAAKAVGVGVTTLREAIRNGDLIAHYPTSRPVVLRSELEEWLKSTPTEGRAA